MIGLGIAFLMLPSTAVSFRVWAKRLGRKGLAGDDYLIFVALVNIRIIQPLALYKYIESF